MARRTTAPKRSRLPTTSPSALLDVVADVASRLASVAPERADREVRAALRRILALFDVDRCAVYAFRRNVGVLELVQRVDRGTSTYVRGMASGREQFPWVFDRVVAQKKVVAFKSLDDLPAAAHTDKKSFRRSGIRSALLIPIVEAGAVDHVVTFASSHASRRWPARRVRQLRLLGETFVSAIRRKADTQAQAEAQRFERLIFDLSTRFAGARWDQVDEQINIALHELRAFTSADQCGFFTVFPETGHACLSYLASHKVTMPLGAKPEYASLTPWLYEKVVNRKETAWFSRRDDLPAEASVDKQHLAAMKTQAALYVPYPVDGVTRYLLAVVTNDRGHSWPEHIVERVKVLGTVFAGALNRKAAVGAHVTTLERLGVAKRFAQATLDALNEYVGVIDDTGTLVESSDKWASLADGDEAAAEAVPVGGNYLAACESTTGPSREAAVKLARGIRSVLHGGAEKFAMETARMLQGSLTWLHCWVRRFVVDGAVYAAVSVEDITSRRQDEQALQELRAQQWHSERITQTGVLIGSVAHELSQPLTAILSNAQAGMRFIASNALDLGEIREILSDIIADDKRAGAIIETLRIMLRRQSTARELVDVGNVVHDVARLLHSEFIRRQVEMGSDCAPDCIVHVNRSQIQQVLLNLMVNSIDAMRPVTLGRRSLRVTAGRTTEGKIRVAVRDTGIGISEADLERAFEAFWTSKSTGTGMGLTICQSIVESHGGRIWGERNDDVGSTFLVELPAAGLITANDDGVADAATVEVVRRPIPQQAMG